MKEGWEGGTRGAWLLFWMEEGNKEGKREAGRLGSIPDSREGEPARPCLAPARPKGSPLELRRIPRRSRPGRAGDEDSALSEAASPACSPTLAAALPGRWWCWRRGRPLLQARPDTTPPSSPAHLGRCSRRTPPPGAPFGPSSAARRQRGPGAPLCAAPRSASSRLLPLQPRSGSGRRFPGLSQVERRALLPSLPPAGSQAGAQGRPPGGGASEPAPLPARLERRAHRAGATPTPPAAAAALYHRHHYHHHPGRRRGGATRTEKGRQDAWLRSAAPGGSRGKGCRGGARPNPGFGEVRGAWVIFPALGKGRVRRRFE